MVFTIMRLVADVMLAKLARWLRLAGINVEDAKATDDNRLIRSVRQKGAILITADKQLAMRSKRRKFKVLYVPYKELDSQLAFVASRLKLHIGTNPAMICPKCGGTLVKVQKDRVTTQVPELAYKRNRYFYRCRRCGKIYWKGTHWKAISKRLMRIKMMMKSSSY